MHFVAMQPASDPDLPTFKARLLQLARARRLRLVRAHLVEAMDPRNVECSEVRDGLGTYHFIPFP
jgi:hypothetical protein